VTRPLASTKHCHLPHGAGSPPPAVQFGYLVNGERIVQVTLPKASNGEVAILTRDPVSNSISIDYGPQWNSRFRNSVLPANIRFVCRLKAGILLPNETPTIFLPLAGGRHISY